jgi:hypothetical protein
MLSFVRNRQKRPLEAPFANDGTSDTLYRSFLLARPTTSSLSNRPAHGGTCYSGISTVVVTAYDNSSAVATSTWVASVSGAQAYALVIEGYAAANATSGNGIFASSVSAKTRISTLTQ